MVCHIRGFPAHPPWPLSGRAVGICHRLNKKPLITQFVISGTGVYSPPHVLTNEELVESFNKYVAKEHASCNPNTKLEESSADFIKKASGIERRFCVDKDGILDPSRMRPRLEPRSDEELSIQAEMGLAASREALKAAGSEASEIDAVLVACSNYQRAYPAIAVELQDALGAKGFAYDMNVACSSATFGATPCCKAAVQTKCWW